MNETQKENNQIQRFSDSFKQALHNLNEAPAFAKSRYQTEVFRLATALMDSDEGMSILYECAHEFDSAGVFHGGPWERATELIPSLVKAGLKGEGVYPTVETLSELRMLAIAKEKYNHKEVSSVEARKFLIRTIALNLELLFAEPTEESRKRPKVFARAFRLFTLLKNEISLDGIQKQLLEEIEFLIAQRPIQNIRLQDLIIYVGKLVLSPQTEIECKLYSYYKAITAPSVHTKKTENDSVKYRSLLLELDEKQIDEEITAFIDSNFQKIGLSHPCFAVLIRHLCRESPDRIPHALSLDDSGQAEFEKNKEFCLTLIKVAIFPSTANSIYGFSRVLQRNLLSRSEIKNGLKKLIELDIHTDMKKLLMDNQEKNSGLTANSILMAGTLSVLGQPLGVRQGNNPTCQAARGISLWSQHAPGFLLQIITSAARNNLVEMYFEATLLKSNELIEETPLKLDNERLDAVSLIVVPHLNKIYNEMMKRASYRGEDQHKWVNPAFYGRWVSKGFACVFDVTLGKITHYKDFVRRFFATHHPSFNGGNQLVYPNPVGIFVTDIHGKLLGLHAISIQRIKSFDNKLRVYFYNPNNEGRQQWGNTIKTTVSGHGEKPGESSLAFNEFTSRLYAFHFNPYEEGDAYAVPGKIIEEIEDVAQLSWGQSYTWEN